VRLDNAEANQKKLDDDLANISGMNKEVIEKIAKIKSSRGIK
jgi:hypothetical protein